STVARVSAGAARPVPLSKHFTRILSLTTDAGDGLWITDEEQGVFRWANNALSRMPLPPSANGAAVALADTNGDVWIAFHDGGVALYRNGQIQSYFENETLIGVMAMF